MAAEISDAPTRPDSRPEEPSTVVVLTDGQRLRARGASFVLNGARRRAMLDYEALEFLEREFAGLDEFQASLFIEGWKASRVRNIRLGLTGALLHEKSAEQDIDDFIEEIRGQIGEDTRTRSAFEAFSEYRDALLAALVEAFPVMEANPGPKDKGRGDSRGRSSTNSRRSTSAARMPSSGA